MRANLVAMLDGIGLNAKLEVDSTRSLFGGEDAATTWSIGLVTRRSSVPPRGAFCALRHGDGVSGIRRWRERIWHPCVLTTFDTPRLLSGSKQKGTCWQSHAAPAGGASKNRTCDLSIISAAL
jgi:hypothetical protein